MGTETAAAPGVAGRVRLVDFDDAQVIPGIVPGTYFLSVRGDAPCFNMDVRLVPRIYIQCPEYWGIEVVGTLCGDICLDTLRPYSEMIPLAGITGCIGIEVVGRNRSQRFEVPGGCDCPEG